MSELRLTDVELARWERDGFFVRERAFGESELVRLRSAAEDVAAKAEVAVASGAQDDYCIDGNRYVEARGSTVQFEHAPDTRTLRVIEPFHAHSTCLSGLIDDSRLVEPMKGLVGSERVALWTDKLNLKRPREGSGFRFHQDSPYWTHACGHVDRLPNVMVALDDADESNGCFRVIRGSHRRGCLPGIQDDTTLGPLFTDPSQFDRADEVAVAMPAGSLCFFSPHTVHGSEPNASDAARRALVITYQPGDCPMFKVAGIRNAGD